MIRWTRHVERHLWKFYWEQSMCWTLSENQKKQCFFSYLCKRKSFSLMYSVLRLYWHRSGWGFSLYIVVLKPIFFQKEDSWVKKGMHITWDCVQQGTWVWEVFLVAFWQAQTDPMSIKGCRENFALEKELWSKPDNEI